MNRLVVVALSIVCLAGPAAGCGGSSPTRSSATPTLKGGIRFFGRIPPGYTASGHQRGVVQVLRRGKVVASAQLGQGQGYRFALRPGVYALRTWGNAKPGTYPPCPLSHVTVRAGHTAWVNVACEFH